ncbi:hypothetical protein DEO72_LG1g3168 [Vigna unguiculata]|uniref:Uncharacterized protein n=1 Tax=Vigna unguiculata TaxID=3917 RepID=A0A4D6KN65_VIGUN|nr:hypothetical protein DEO72_LG1g3168 [Vigna unguiculata]
MGEGGSMTKRSSGSGSSSLNNPLALLLRSFHGMSSIEYRFRSPFDSYAVACEAFSEPHPL